MLGATVGVMGVTSPRAMAAPTARLVLPVNPKVLLLGDSYTEGVGASPKTNGYAFKVAAPLGWTLTIDGKGGSGYNNPTTYGAGTYADRLVKQPADAFDLVVLQGGSNDDRYDSVTVKPMIEKALNVVASRFPKAKLVVVGPSNPYGSANADRLRINDLLVSVLAPRSVPYVNPIAEKWFMPGDGSMFADAASGHPSNAGHAHLRSLFVRDMQVLTA